MRNTQRMIIYFIYRGYDFAVRLSIKKQVILLLIHPRVYKNVFKGKLKKLISNDF